MKTIHTLTLAAALTASAFLSLPVSAAEVCDTTCVGPLCNKNCVKGPATTGRDEKVIIGERNKREHPGVVIEENRRPAPGVEVDINTRR